MILLRNVVGQRIPIYLGDVTNPDTPETGITFTPQYSKNGLAFVNFTNTKVEIGLGWYYVEPTDTEVNTDGMFICRATAAGCKPYQLEHEVRGLLQTADIKAQVDDALTEPYPEPTGDWTASASVVDAVLDIRQWLFNKHDSTQLSPTAGEVVVKLDNGTTSRFKKAWDRVGNVFTVNKPTNL